MASSFGAFDLTSVIERDDDWALPYWEPNDPINRVPLAYGGESVQDNGYRVMSMTLNLYLTSIAQHKALRAISGTTATLIYNDLVFNGVTLVVMGGSRWYVDGAVGCTVRLTVKGWSL